MLPLTQVLMALFFGWFPVSPAGGMCHSRDSSGSLWALYFLHMDSHLQSESCTSAATFHHCSISQYCHTANIRCADPALCMLLHTTNSRKAFSLLCHTERTWIKCYSYKCKDNNCQCKTLHLTHNLECATFISSKSFVFKFKYLALSVVVYRLQNLTL